MDASTSALAHPRGPAIWYLARGEQIVGPVRTELLLRGVSSGRLPEDVLVARECWSSWRELHRIREVSDYFKSQQEPLTARSPAGASIEDFREARDPDDCFRIALQLAAAGCSAHAGLVHRSLPPHIGLVTTHSYSLALKDALAEVVPWFDETRDAAMAGAVMLGCVGPHAWARATARRLYTGVPLEGLAVVPVRHHAGQQSLIELGRFDHSFRVSDEAKLLRIRDALLQRLDQLAY